jgi:hypothetical protein
MMVGACVSIRWRSHHDVSFFSFIRSDFRGSHHKLNKAFRAKSGFPYINSKAWSGCLMMTMARHSRQTWHPLLILIYLPAYQAGVLVLLGPPRWSITRYCNSHQSPSYSVRPPLQFVHWHGAILRPCLDA